EPDRRSTSPRCTAPAAGRREGDTRARSRPALPECGSARRDPNLCGVIVVPELDEVLDFCAEDPVERVLLEDIARRGLGRFVARRGNGKLDALCHVGTNIVPSGQGCEAFAERALERKARMVVGAEPAVDELWDAVRERLPAPRDDRPDQPV